MDTKGIIIWAVFIVVCGAIILFSRKIRRETEEEGIETTGVISRIADEGGIDAVDFRYYVIYRTMDGEEIEGMISNPASGLMEGQQVRIKYHPKYKQNARLI